MRVEARGQEGWADECNGLRECKDNLRKQCSVILKRAT